MLCGRRSPDGALCDGEVSVSLAPWEFYQEYYGGNSGIEVRYGCKKCHKQLVEEKIKGYKLPTDKRELEEFLERAINGAKPHE
jgi:hypothetical protein